MNRRNRTAACDLQPWFERGPGVLLQLDAAERSAELKAAPRAPADDLRTLAERLGALGRRIASRLDRLALADLAPGSVFRGHERFVGRHRELSALHTIMMTGGNGMIAAAHSPGGLGKTALARQYAHAYAEFYAAGGTWEIGCEGIASLGAALLKLVDDQRLRTAGEKILAPLALTEAQRADPDLAAAAILDFLARLTRARVGVLREALGRHPDRHSPQADLPAVEQPRCLLVFDNVDQPALLSANQLARLPAAEWLEIIVTTRLDPAGFGAGDRWLRAQEIQPLPDADALDLLRDFQFGRRFDGAAEEQAAREIVRALGGYTLAVELVAAYLGDHAAEGFRPSDFARRLSDEGLLAVDALPGEERVAAQVRHSQKQVGAVLDWSLARLSPPALTALRSASLLQPDRMPLPWLELLTRRRHADALTDRPGYPAKWPGVWRELHGLRLIHPAEAAEGDEATPSQLPRLARIHRLVAGHAAGNDPDGAGTLAELDQFLYALATRFEQQVGQGEDAALREEHPWLRDHLSHLVDRQATPALLRSAQVAADFEGEHGTLSRALDLSERILAGKEKLLAAHPDSPDLARDVSISLERLADFLARRGLPGDAEKAIDYYERGMGVRERLLAANPESAQAARDVMVSCERMARITGGQPGLEAVRRALEFQLKALDIALKLRDGNPRSVYHGRAAAVSFFLASQCALAAGEQEIAGKCRGGYHAVLHELVSAGCALDAAMMRLYQQLNEAAGGPPPSQ